MGRLTGRTVAFLTSDKGIEEPELTTPWQAVVEAGGTALLVSAEPGTVRAVNNDLDPGGEYPVDRTLDQVSAADLDGLVIPGGTELSARLDVARTAMRRAERRIVALKLAGELEDETVLRFVNRASDLLFAAARYADEPDPELFEGRG